MENRRIAKIRTLARKQERAVKYHSVPITVSSEEKNRFGPMIHNYRSEYVR